MRPGTEFCLQRIIGSRQRGRSELGIAIPRHLGKTGIGRRQHTVAGEAYQFRQHQPGITQAIGLTLRRLDLACRPPPQIQPAAQRQGPDDDGGDSPTELAHHCPFWTFREGHRSRG